MAKKHQIWGVTQKPQLPMKFRKLSEALVGNRKCQNNAVEHFFIKRCRMLSVADMTTDAWFTLILAAPEDYAPLLEVWRGHLT